MSKVFCAKLQQELDALDYPPYPGEVGQRILKEISVQAWKNWVGEQTKIINEYRLNPLDPQARQMIEKSMLDYLFSEKSD